MCYMHHKEGIGINKSIVSLDYIMFDMKKFRSYE